MDKDEALRILLIEICCSNGKEFCKLCPVYKENSCEQADGNEKQLLEAVKTLTNYSDALNKVT